MTWFRVDDAFPECDKVQDLEDDPEIWAAAIALWTIAGCKSSAGSTDGFIRERRIGRFTPLSDELERRAADALVECGLWERVPGGYQFHDWADYNPTKVELTESRKLKAERQAKWRKSKRLARDGGPRDAGVERLQDAPRDAGVERLQDASRDAAPSRPVPSRPVPSRDPHGGVAPAGARVIAIPVPEPPTHHPSQQRSDPGMVRCEVCGGVGRIEPVRGGFQGRCAVCSGSGEHLAGGVDPHTLILARLLREYLPAVDPGRFAEALTSLWTPRHTEANVAHAFKQAATEVLDGWGEDQVRRKARVFFEHAPRHADRETGREMNDRGRAAEAAHAETRTREQAARHAGRVRRQERERDAEAELMTAKEGAKAALAALTGALTGRERRTAPAAATAPEDDEAAGPGPVKAGDLPGPAVSAVGGG